MPSININGLLRGLEHVANHKKVAQKMDTVISFQEMTVSGPNDHMQAKLVIGLYPADFHVILDQDEEGNTYGVMSFGESGLGWGVSQGWERTLMDIHRKKFYYSEDICAVALTYMVLFESMLDIKKVIMENSLDNSL